CGAHAARTARPLCPRGAGHEFRKSARRNCRLHRLSRRHQSEHAARAREDAVAAHRTLSNSDTFFLPAWSAGDAEVFSKRHSKGVQTNLNDVREAEKVWRRN